MLEILDAVIATAAVALGLSLIVQAIQQIIKQGFELKSSYMRDELLALFGVSTRLAADSAQKLLPVASFAEAGKEHITRLVDELEKRFKGIGYKDIDLIEFIDPTKLKEIVRSLPLRDIVPPKVEEDYEKIVREIEEEIDRWLDLSKKAFQDHYARKMKVWAFGISALIVMAMNVNLIDTYTLFSTNKSVREAAIAMGERLTSLSSDSLAKLVGVDTLKTKSDSLIVADIRSRAGAVEKIIEDKSFQPFGWQGAALARIRSRSPLENVFVIPFGWLGMTLLVSLGAPFWYDLLKSVMGVKELLKKK